MWSDPPPCRIDIRERPEAGGVPRQLSSNHRDLECVDKDDQAELLYLLDSRLYIRLTASIRRRRWPSRAPRSAASPAPSRSWPSVTPSSPLGSTPNARCSAGSSST